MNDYLPENAPSTTSMDVMDEEFSGSVASTRMMIVDINIAEAHNVKEQLSDIDGVSGVTWLDDVINIKIPLELIENDNLETYYKNDNALFAFEVEEGKE